MVWAKHQKEARGDLQVVHIIGYFTLVIFIDYTLSPRVGSIESSSARSIEKANGGNNQVSHTVYKFFINTIAYFLPTHASWI